VRFPVKLAQVRFIVTLKLYDVHKKREEKKEKCDRYKMQSLMFLPSEYIFSFFFLNICLGNNYITTRFSSWFSFPASRQVRSRSYQNRRGVWKNWRAIRVRGERAYEASRSRPLQCTLLRPGFMLLKGTPFYYSGRSFFRQKLVSMKSDQSRKSRGTANSSNSIGELEKAKPSSAKLGT